MLEKIMIVVILIAIVAIVFGVWSTCKVASEADKKSVEMEKLTKKHMENSNE